MTDPVDRAAVIAFQIDQLASANGHHAFEDICFHLAKAEITTNLLPATGPVSSGGDQGRDFETYRGTIGNEDIAFSCTIQRDGLRAKITTDVKKITSTGEHVNAVVAMFSGDFPVGQRHAFIEQIRNAFGIRLQLHDRKWMADKLAEEKNFWIAERFLAIPAEIGPGGAGYQQVLQRLDARSDFDASLEMLPFPAAQILAAETTHRALAERIVDGIVRGDPRVVLRAWSVAPPEWIQNAPAAMTAALGHLAQSYGLHHEGGEWFERAGRDGYEPARCLIRAALQASAAGDIDRVKALLGTAQTIEDGPVVRAMLAWIEFDWATILATINDEIAIDDPLAVSPYLAALQQNGQGDDAITFLRKYIARHEHHAGLALTLSRLLSERSTHSGSADRQQDQAEALTLAVRARDLRRRWRGDSTEAVRIACTAAIVAGLLTDVIRLGTVAPDGDALEHEAADRDVQSCVAQAALGTGDMATAVRIESSTTGFQQALIRGDILHVSHAPQEEIDAQFLAAWDQAEDEDNKVQFWLSAASAGVDPLPGSDELEARDDELALLCKGSSLVARGLWDEAITRLRPERQIEKARQVLVQAYRGAGRLDDAVTELMDMSGRFFNVEHAIKAIELLVSADRVADAAPYASVTLPQVRLGRPERNFLHEVGVAAASYRGDWVEMERLASAWISESGPARRRRWLLAMAINNQADSERAWRTLQQGGPCEVAQPLEAQLWIALHHRYAPGLATLREAMRLAKRFDGDGPVRAAATTAFLFGGDERDELTPAEITEWQQMIADRAANPDPDDTFVAISVPDDLDGLVESLRPMLEPQAQRIAEMLVQVRQHGWPQGMLAMAAGRPYTKTLVQRAAGYLAVASPDQSIVSIEIDAALAALASGRVVVDASAVVTGWHLQNLWPRLISSFVNLAVTADTRMDAATSSDAGHPRSTEILGWDNDLGHPVLHEIAAEDLERIESHVGWVIGQMSMLSVRPTPPTREGKDIRDLPWLSAIMSAEIGGLPLWADDAGVRVLARQQGVPAFGTDALMFALLTNGTMSEEEIQSSTVALRNEFCTDFPFDPAWTLEAAAREGWAAGPAMLAMGRPATWSDVPTSYMVWQEIAMAAGASDVSKVPAWIYTATTALGLAVVDRAVAFRLVASLLLQAAAATNGDPPAFAACAGAASQAAEQIGMPDPTELGLLIILSAAANDHGLAEAREALATLGSELVGVQREALDLVLSNSADS
ncbi:MAG TPA: hypothetical protein PK020_04090 [Ilumatobacteraceae bacterium]|nr:hypothetical protein [Ilumatobacteraceae bacterium]